jgi:hypothetical protein
MNMIWLSLFVLQLSFCYACPLAFAKATAKASRTRLWQARHSRPNEVQPGGQIYVLYGIQPTSPFNYHLNMKDRTSFTAISGINYSFQLL